VSITPVVQLFRSQWTPAGGWSEPLAPVDGPETLVLAFGGAASVVAPAVTELAGAYPRSALIGCSTAGEITDERIDDGTLSVTIVRFEATAPSFAAVDVADPCDSAPAGRELGRRLLAAGPAPNAVFVLADGLGIDSSAALAALQAQIGPGVPISGGLAGDGERFGSTWVLAGATGAGGPLIAGRRIAAIGLSGPRLQVAAGSRGGWDSFGPERRVTRSEGNVLHELDGAPALALYKRYLGDRAGGLPATALLFPLAIRGETPGADPVVRTILGIDEAAQTLTFAAGIPEGATVSLMRANVERLVDGAHDAAQRSMPGGEAVPTLAIAISCVGRRIVLGHRCEEELEATLAMLPAGTRQCGFYSYGEISPAGESCVLHNQTMTMTTIREV
jgi:hypothetical protein